MADLYRKSSLEKLSSPEQLDRMIVITSPSFWIAMLGVGVMVAAALLWSVFGHLPVKVKSSGIYMNSSGVFSIYAQADGVVTEVDVAEGTAVTEGQMLMRLSNDSQAHEMVQLQQRIDNVLAITLVSETDEATADNKDLIDIKAQHITLTADLRAAKTALAQKQNGLTTQTAETTRLGGAMESAKTTYYNALGGSGGTAIQLEYQEASTAHSQASSTFDSLNMQYETVQIDMQVAADSYLAAIAEENIHLVSPLEVALLDPIALGLLENTFTYEALVPLWLQYSEQVAVEAKIKPSYDMAKTAIEAADTRLEKARAAYTQVSTEQQSNSAETQRLSSEFQLAQSNYQSALSLQKNTEAEVASLQQQINAENLRVNSKSIVLDTQFTTARQAVLSQLKAELAKYTLSEGQLEVVADRAGVVTGLQIKQGAVVSAGTELAKVKQENAAENVVVCYVPLTEGKGISPGMKVMISPTTVNEQEYGHIEANVLKVDSFTTTSTDIMAQLGDNVLTEAFIKDGPVVAVTCQLETDPATASGYRWSNRKGSEIVMAEGTLVTARIVTEEKTPISMIIPYLKEKFTVQEKAG